MLWASDGSNVRATRRGQWVSQSAAECYALKRGYTWLTSTSPDVFNDWLPLRDEAMLFTHHEAQNIADRLNKVRAPMMPFVEVVKLA